MRDWVAAVGRPVAALRSGPQRRAVVGWVLYDLANTLFSFNVVSLYFALWVVDDMGGRDGDFLIANSASMALMFLTAPILGALSDQAPRRMPFLVVSTLACCAFTFVLGLGGLPLSLVCFAVANYFFQAGLIFYDALLPTVSTEANRGTVGGLGVGIGYVGSLIGVGTGLATLQLGGDKPLVFRLTAALFLAFALPCFFWVRERRRTDVAPFGPAAVRRAVRELRGTLVRVRRYPDLRRFLVGRIFYADVANTLIAVMGIYANKELGFGDGKVQAVSVVGIVTAIVGGVAWGRLVDRVGPKQALNRVLRLWALVLTVAALIGLLDLPGDLFWLVAPFVGIALGGTWAADRPYMLRLSPPRQLGQFYGLYAMVGRFAAIVGPLLWTAVVDWLGWGRPVAILSLLVLVLVAYVVLQPVSDARRAWSQDELVPAA